jgi:D-alanyl-D-alanine endopeptidase (penicillin-binding protein 7)
MLGAEDAETANAFAVPGVPVFVYTGNEVRTPSDDTPIPLETDGALPATTARSYVVADLESGQVYLEKESSSRYPIASITKFVTATVASGIIPHSEEILAPNGEKYTLGDLYYLLLLRSDNGTADAIASHVGTEAFIASMNTFTSSLGLSQTSFADPSGLSPKNISTARDLAHLAGYLYEQKPFVLDISSEESMTITSSSGTRLGLENQNKLAWDPHFRGGKLGFTDEALQTSLAIFSLPVDGKVRPVAVVILGSNDWKQDTRTLLRWLLQNTKAIER